MTIVPQVCKAAASDILGRFREIVSDPLNLLIERHPLAGVVEDGWVTLHNGNKAPIEGEFSYYNKFSDILAINRGVHEPLEEFVFQAVLKVLPSKPTMLELGSYWAHYSMWLARQRPSAKIIMVEPETTNINAGKLNFQANGFQGEFLQAFVGNGHFVVDDFFDKAELSKIEILHADIQGYEIEMLHGAKNSLSSTKIDYVFVSTHSQQLHVDTVRTLTDHNYRIEAESDFDNCTTSYDGLVFASSPNVSAIFSGGLQIANRQRINEMSVNERIDFIRALLAQTF